MAILVVGGSGKDVGKTALVCAVISALPEFNWTAVKITAHDYESSRKPSSDVDEGIREETRAGQETDTARYLAAGARRALLVSRSGPDVPIESIRKAIGSDRNIIFESNRIVGVLKPDVCIALISGHEKKPSFERLMLAADAFVTLKACVPESVPAGMPQFHLESVDRLPVDFVAWLKLRLSRVST